MQKREHITDWIEKAFKYLMRNSEVLKNSVNVCGITSCGSTNVCRTDHFQSCMTKAIDNIDCHKVMRIHLLYKEDPFAVFAGLQTTFIGFYFHKLFFLDFMSLFL